VLGIALAAALGLVGMVPRPDLPARGQPAGPPPAQDAEIVVDGAVTHQSWDGWGLSISGRPWEWTVLNHLHRVPSVEQRWLQDSLFGSGGYNLAITYAPLTPGRSGSHAEGYEPRNDDSDSGRFDWGGFRFLYTPGDPDPYADPGQDGYTAATFRAIADLQRYGTTLIFNADGFPAWLLPSGRTLPHELEPELAEHVAAFPAYVRRELGYTFPYAIVANEPDRTLHTSPEQHARLLRLTRDRLRREGLSTQLLGPNTLSLASGLAYAAAILRDADLAADVPILAAHSYPTDAYDTHAADAIRRLARTSGRRLWLTEYSSGPDLNLARDDPADTSARALAWAARVHQDLTELQVNAWFALFPVLEPGHYPADALVIVQPDYADPTRNRWGFTRRYYALAQYTRFIRPGAVRLETSARSSDVEVLAFRDADNETIALVALNRGAGDVRANVRFENASVGATLAYRTSTTESLVCLGPATVTDASVALMLPAESITTLVAGPASAALDCPG
jgi:O-glycosyl hydrolase